MEVIKLQFLLESIRRANKESQENMAKLIGVDVRTYQNKEKGITQFKQNEMFIIARYFNKKIEEIFLPTNFGKQEACSMDFDDKKERNNEKEKRRNSNKEICCKSN